MLRKFGILILACNWTFGALAATTASSEGLYKEWKRQSQWQDVSVSVEGLNRNFTGTLTESGRLRLDDFSGDISSQARVISSTWDGFGSQEAFKEYCNVTSNIIDDRSKVSTPFALEFGIVPMASGLYSITKSNGTKAFVSGAENKFKPFEWFQVTIESQPDSLTSKTLNNHQSKELVQRLIKQLEGDREGIAKSGTISLDLTQYTDLACDIIHGRAQIKVKTVVHYDAARLNRDLWISPQDLLRVYDEAQSRAKATPKSNDVHILSSAYLALAADKNGLGMDMMSPDEFLRLFNLLHNPTNGKLHQLSSSELVEVNEAMARIEQRGTWSITTYIPKLVEGEK